MTLAVYGYKTKKILKESVSKSLNYTETSMFGAEYKSTGTFCVVGPDAVQRKWFAEITMRDDVIVKVT